MDKDFNWTKAETALPPGACRHCGGEGHVHGTCAPTPDNPDGVTDAVCARCNGSGLAKKGPHLIQTSEGVQFQSDKYPACPTGKVPLSVKDKMAQDILWEYAQRRRQIDTEFSDDLEWALQDAGYVPPPSGFRADIEANIKYAIELYADMNIVLPPGVRNLIGTLADRLATLIGKGRT